MLSQSWYFYRDADLSSNFIGIVHPKMKINLLTIMYIADAFTQTAQNKRSQGNNYCLLDSNQPIMLKNPWNYEIYLRTNTA